jgi:hypothetical protein
MVDDLPDWLQEEYQQNKVEKDELISILADDLVQVSDREQFRASLLETWGNNDSSQAPAQIPHKSKPSRVLRLLMIFAILCSVLLPQLFPAHQSVFSLPRSVLILSRFIGSF